MFKIHQIPDVKIKVISRASIRYWSSYIIIFIVGIIGTAMVLVPGMQEALKLAQVDAGNQVQVGIFLRDLLGEWTSYFTALYLSSIFSHVLGNLVFDVFASKNKKDGRIAREANTTAVLIVTTFLLILLCVVLVAVFDFLSVISIEENFLQ
jgi:hypothetical protein